MPYCRPGQRTRFLRNVCFKTNFWLGVTQIVYVVSDDERDISLNKVIIGVVALVTWRKNLGLVVSKNRGRINNRKMDTVL